MIRQLIATVLTALALSAFSFNATAAVDANAASQAELETVKGIGPGLSGKIIEARQSAPFKNWQDLVDRVGGVGPGNATKFSQAGLTVAGSTYDGSATAPAKAAKGEKAAKAEKAEKTDKVAKAPKDGADAKPAAKKSTKDKAETPST